MLMDFDDSITLKEVIDQIDSGALIGSICFVTSDKKRDTGGEWIEIRDARKHTFLNKNEQAKLDKVQPITSGVAKDPQHYQNSTRNLKLKNGEIRKIHLRLIRKFNTKTVI